MLQIFKSGKELLEALKLIGPLPELLSLRAAVKHRIAGRIPDSPIELCAYPWPNVKCWMMIMRNTLAEPYVSLHLINGGKVSDAENCFENATSSLAEFDEFYLFNTDIKISNQLRCVLSETYRFDDEDDMGTTFFMPHDITAEIATREIKVPVGYRLCDLDPDIDAPLVSKTWKYGRYDDIHFTHAKLTHLPSIGVKYDDRLVSFEMICPTGSLNHLYTLPEFRGKGLGTAVELKLCQKLIALDIQPFKYVGVDNHKVIEMSKKCGYWHQITEKQTDAPVVYDFRKLTKLREVSAG